MAYRKELRYALCDFARLAVALAKRAIRDKHMEDCIFCKIANKEIPKEFTYEDDDVMVFPDLSPVKPIHLLVVPKKHIADFLHVDDPKLMHKLWLTVQKMAKEQGIEDKGFRIIVNAGGAQVVPHLHIHIIGPLGHAVKD